MARNTRIVVVGGGYVGMYTALRLQKKLRRGEASVTVIDPQSHMTYQPFLPEAAAGSIEPRHVVVPLRKVLKRCHHLTGRVTSIDHAARVVTAELAAGHVTTVGYDVLVVAPGSVARTLPIPGLAEQRHRVQDRRRGDLPAQPRAVPARRRGHHDRPEPAQAAAHLPRRRRWLRRHRGAGRAGRHGPIRHPLLREHRPRRPALGPRRGGRPDHARGRPEDGRLHRRSGCSTPASRSSWTPA